MVALSGQATLIRGHNIISRAPICGLRWLSGKFVLCPRNYLVQIVGDNLTNAHGLTEGNTVRDTFSGQGTPEAVFGRPIFGRSARLIISRGW